MNRSATKPTHESPPRSRLNLVEIKTPSRYGEVLRTHLPYLLITLPFLLGARMIPMGMRLAPTCMFKRTTGLPCPFCGYTRAFQRIARLEVWTALSDNPGAFVLFVFMMAVMLWNMAGLLAGKRILPGALLRIGNRRLVIGGIATFFVLNWIFRLLKNGQGLIDI